MSLDDSYDNFSTETYAEENLYMVIGPGRHGKGTLSKIFLHGLGIQGCSSSFFASHHLGVARTIAKELGVYPEGEGSEWAMQVARVLADVYDDRINHRELWAHHIAELNKDDPTFVATGLYQHYQLYDGCRKRREFNAIVKKFQPLIIWVDASERVRTWDVSLELTRDDADIIITNNGTEKEFADKVERLMYRLRPSI